MKPQFNRTCFPIDPESRQILQVARLQRGLSLRQVAKATGIGASQLSRYENGRCNPTLDALARWCEVLGLEYTPATCYVWRATAKGVAHRMHQPSSIEICGADSARHC